MRVAKVMGNGQGCVSDVDEFDCHVLASDIVEGADEEDFGAGGAHQHI